MWYGTQSQTLQKFRLGESKSCPKRHTLCWSRFPPVYINHRRNLYLLQQNPAINHLRVKFVCLQVFYEQVINEGQLSWQNYHSWNCSPQCTIFPFKSNISIIMLNQWIVKTTHYIFVGTQQLKSQFVWNSSCKPLLLSLYYHYYTCKFYDKMQK